jgi:hypothetical protein
VTSSVNVEFVSDVSETVSLSLSLSLSLSSGVDVMSVVFAPCRRQTEIERIESGGRSERHYIAVEGGR